MPWHVEKNMGIMSFNAFVLIISLLSSCVEASHVKTPAIYVFGDSLVDAGNNNYLLTLTRADSPPNGIDFKASRGQPTGRFTNARTVVDIIGEELGQPYYAVPYLALAPSSKGEVILNGVNYASGGAGILETTGKDEILRMDDQVRLFGVTRKQLDELLGPIMAKEHVMKNSIFTIVIGSNDFLANYQFPVVSIAKRILESPDDFIEKMISHFRSQLTRLYEMDARKFVVSNIGPIGCVPYQNTRVPLKPRDQCAKSSNKLAIHYNTRLRDLLHEFTQNLPGSTFVHVNAYDLLWELITNHDQYGFVTANRGCCESTGGLVEGLISCGLTSTVCTDRSAYLFWDAFHPTEAVNLITAKELLDGKRYVSPMNIRELWDL